VQLVVLAQVGARMAAQISQQTNDSDVASNVHTCTFAVFCIDCPGDLDIRVLLVSERHAYAIIE
jgi:hypothetical protein